MKKIDVNIDKAVINNFYVYLPELKGGHLNSAVYLDLYAGRTKITQIHLSTDSYDKSKKFTLPFKLYEHIGKIARELEKIVALQFKANMAELPEHNGKEI